MYQHLINESNADSDAVAWDAVHMDSTVSSQRPPEEEEEEYMEITADINQQQVRSSLL